GSIGAVPAVVTTGTAEAPTNQFQSQPSATAAPLVQPQSSTSLAQPQISAPAVDTDTSVATPAAPVIQQARPLGDLVISFVDYGNRDAEEECLAKAVYFEARGESLEGQLAVAQVIMNRAASGIYPPSICGVVTQPAQFSFIRGGQFPRVNENSDC